MDTSGNLNQHYDFGHLLGVVHSSQHPIFRRLIDKYQHNPEELVEKAVLELADLIQAHALESNSHEAPVS